MYGVRTVDVSVSVVVSWTDDDFLRQKQRFLWSYGHFFPVSLPSKIGPGAGVVGGRRSGQVQGRVIPKRCLMITDGPSRFVLVKQPGRTTASSAVDESILVLVDGYDVLRVFHA